MHNYVILLLFSFLMSSCEKKTIKPVDTIKTINNRWQADEYADRNTVQHGWAQRFFFDEYRFSGKENVLDIGSGDGAITWKIANQTAGHVIGLDVSPDMTAFAKKNHKADNLFFYYRPC